MRLTWRQGERQGLAAPVGGDADLAAKASTRAAKRLTTASAFSESPFLAAPAAL